MFKFVSFVNNWTIEFDGIQYRASRDGSEVYSYANSFEFLAELCDAPEFDLT